MSAVPKRSQQSPQNSSRNDIARIGNSYYGVSPDGEYYKIGEDNRWEIIDPDDIFNYRRARQLHQEVNNKDKGVLDGAGNIIQEGIHQGFVNRWGVPKPSITEGGTDKLGITSKPGVGSIANTNVTTGTTGVINPNLSSNLSSGAKILRGGAAGITRATVGGTVAGGAGAATTVATAGSTAGMAGAAGAGAVAGAGGAGVLAGLGPAGWAVLATTVALPLLEEKFSGEGSKQETPPIGSYRKGDPDRYVPTARQETEIMGLQQSNLGSSVSEFSQVQNVTKTLDTVKNLLQLYDKSKWLIRILLPILPIVIKVLLICILVIITIIPIIVGFQIISGSNSGGNSSGGSSSSNFFTEKSLQCRGGPVAFNNLPTPSVDEVNTIIQQFRTSWGVNQFLGSISHLSQTTTNDNTDYLLVIAWLHIEGGVDPYFFNCRENAQKYNVARVCQQEHTNSGYNMVQVAGFQFQNRMTDFSDAYNTCYRSGNGNVSGILQRVFDNSVNATKPQWNYKSNLPGYQEFVDQYLFGGRFPNNIYIQTPSSSIPEGAIVIDIQRAYNNPEDLQNQALAFLLAKDPCMAVVLNKAVHRNMTNENWFNNSSYYQNKKQQLSNAAEAVKFYACSNPQDV